MGPGRLQSFIAWVLWIPNMRYWSSGVKLGFSGITLISARSNTEAKANIKVLSWTPVLNPLTPCVFQLLLDEQFQTRLNDWNGIKFQKFSTKVRLFRIVVAIYYFVILLSIILFTQMCNHFISTLQCNTITCHNFKASSDVTKNYCDEIEKKSYVSIISNPYILSACIFWHENPHLYQ